MKIEFDPDKRILTLQTRGLGMAAADVVFDGPHLTTEDDRRDCGEPRFLTIGFPEGRMIVPAWTPRADATRIISMRKAYEREQEAHAPRFAE